MVLINKSLPISCTFYSILSACLSLQCPSRFTGDSPPWPIRRNGSSSPSPRLVPRSSSSSPIDTDLFLLQRLSSPLLDYRSQLVNHNRIKSLLPHRPILYRFQLVCEYIPILLVPHPSSADRPNSRSTLGLCVYCDVIFATGMRARCGAGRLESSFGSLCSRRGGAR